MTAKPAAIRPASPLKKIIWSVDAFPDADVSYARSIRTLKNIAGSGTVIEPVYVMNPDQMLLTLQEAWTSKRRPRTTAELEAIAAKALEGMLGGSQLPGLSKPAILMESDPALNRSVRALIGYAQNSGADLIVLNTHGRKGLQRFLLGSFAETVLLHSPIPVLVMNPGSQPSSGIRKILCPTDFAEDSRRAFDQAVQLAASLGADVTLYHKIPNPVEPVFQSGVHLLGGNWVPVHTYFDREAQLAAEEADRWIADARTKGVAVERIIDDQPGSVSESVLAACESAKADLVAMASETGPIASAIIGSITRQVVRNATCPVWVIHPSNRSWAERTDTPKPTGKGTSRKSPPSKMVI